MHCFPMNFTDLDVGSDNTHMLIKYTFFFWSFLKKNLVDSTKYYSPVTDKKDSKAWLLELFCVFYV